MFKGLLTGANNKAANLNWKIALKNAKSYFEKNKEDRQLMLQATSSMNYCMMQTLQNTINLGLPAHFEIITNPDEPALSNKVFLQISAQMLNDTLKLPKNHPEYFALQASACFFNILALPQGHKGRQEKWHETYSFLNQVLEHDLVSQKMFNMEE